MSITPQGEQYGLFEDRRTASRDLPLPGDLADALRGPSITPGLLNTRTARGMWNHDGTEYVTEADVADIPDDRQDFIDWANSNRRPTDESAIDEWVRDEFSNYPQGPGTGRGERDEYDGDAHDAVYHQLLDDPTLDPLVLPEPPDKDYHRFAQRR